MIEMQVRELCEAVHGELIVGTGGSFRGVSIDSRKIDKDQLFFAIRGEKHDGHEFVSSALAQGAAGAIVDHFIDLSLHSTEFLIQVEDTTKALQQLAHYYRKKFNMTVIGVTGSVGKTTTKDMIATVLSEKYNVLKTEGNLNNYYGLPLTLFQLSVKHQIMVVEMGMSALKEIELLAKLAEPEIGVVTNVGSSHLEFLKSFDNVAIAKRELIENLTGRRIAILNIDDERVEKMAPYASEAIFYGRSTKADYRAISVEVKDLTGTEMTLQAENQEMPVYIPLPGEHNALNALATIAVGRILGMTYPEIQEGLRKFKPSKMRMNIQELKGITLLNDAYNANPESMKAGLQVLAKQSGRKVAVLGDMLELGEFSENAHREIGLFAGQSRVDLIFVKGTFAGAVAKGALAGGMKAENVYTYTNNQDLGEKLLQMIKLGDTVLVKGSRGMKMEEIVKLLEERF